MASIPIPRRYRRIVYLPSKHDETLLEVWLSIPINISSTSAQAFTGVVISHPYGPLGGSYNNNVVGALMQWFETQPLQIKNEEARFDENSYNTRTVPLACVICAVNFRGCGKSKGKTSWTGEAERQDYQTAVDFLQSGTPAYPFSTPAPWSGKVYDETGAEIDRPRLPPISRFILSGFSYGGLIASTIPPPLRFTSSPESGHLPTSYIFVSFPAGVAWFLTSGSQGSFFKRAQAILQGNTSNDESKKTTITLDADENAKDFNKKETSTSTAVEAFFITGDQDQFTSSKTLLNWLKSYAGMSPPPTHTQDKSNSIGGDGSSSWAVTRPDGGSIHVEVLEGVDHFWLDREQKLLRALKNWWSDRHYTQ
ncbi:hypothetical protein BGZ83_008427 [Gryganskiella cystojenkinii]|nr:hypothetical protein BGZ83_008427 [Gryganskiella cystojenkinii]